MTLDEFFEGCPESRRIFDQLHAMMVELGEVELRVGKSQVSFRRRKAFAWAWMPGRYLKGRTAPLVLTLSLAKRDSSPRWKEIVEPVPGKFTHHLELNSIDDLDEQVMGWLIKATSSTK